MDERLTQSKKRSRSTSFGWNWPRTTVQLGYVKITYISIIIIDRFRLSHGRLERAEESRIDSRGTECVIKERKW